MTLPVLKSSDCMVRVRRSELSDHVSKLNRQEEKILERRLRVLKKQERVAEHLLDRNIHDAERLRHFIKDQSGRAMNLTQYDSRKSNCKNANYGFGVRFPPLSSGSTYMTSTPRPAPLSRRALRETGSETKSKESMDSAEDRLVVHLRDLRFR